MQRALTALARVVAPVRARSGRWRAWRHIVDFLRRAPASATPDPYGPLTVGALIDQLGRFDRRMRVIMPGEGEDWSDVFEAHLDIFSPQRRSPERLELADDGDPGAIVAVRLFGDPDEA